MTQSTRARFDVGERKWAVEESMLITIIPVYKNAPPATSVRWSVQLFVLFVSDGQRYAAEETFLVREVASLDRAIAVEDADVRSTAFTGCGDDIH